MSSRHPFASLPKTHIAGQRQLLGHKTPRASQLGVRADTPHPTGRAGLVCSLALPSQGQGLPGLVSLELYFCLQLLFPHTCLLGLTLLLEEEGRSLLSKFIFCLLLILKHKAYGTPLDMAHQVLCRVCPAVDNATAVTSGCGVQSRHHHPEEASAPMLFIAQHKEQPAQSRQPTL